jgi:peroxiredoxin
MVEVGQEAPDFTLRGATGKEVTLSDLRGKQRALLIFYPQDMTSG